MGIFTKHVVLPLTISKVIKCLKSKNNSYTVTLPTVSMTGHIICVIRVLHVLQYLIHIHMSSVLSHKLTKIQEITGRDQLVLVSFCEVEYISGYFSAGSPT